MRAVLVVGARAIRRMPLLAPISVSAFAVAVGVRACERSLFDVGHPNGGKASHHASRAARRHCNASRGRGRAQVRFRPASGAVRGVAGLEHSAGTGCRESVAKPGADNKLMTTR